MKIIDKFLNLDLLKKINHKKHTFAQEYHHGYTNLSWQKNLVTDSSLIFIMPFNEINDEIKQLFIKELKNPKLKNMTFITQMYVWFRGSTIYPHCDSDYYLGATIYLNKRWTFEKGGLLLYKPMDQPDTINTIIPKYNRCVINEKNETHMVSQIVQSTEEPRVTIQIFVKNLLLNY